MGTDGVATGSAPVRRCRSRVDLTRAASWYDHAASAARDKLSTDVYNQRKLSSRSYKCAVCGLCEQPNSYWATAWTVRRLRVAHWALEAADSKPFDPATRKLRSQKLFDVRGWQILAYRLSEGSGHPRWWSSCNRQPDTAGAGHAWLGSSGLLYYSRLATKIRDWPADVRDSKQHNKNSPRTSAVRASASTRSSLMNRRSRLRMEGGGKMEDGSWSDWLEVACV